MSRQEKFREPGEAKVAKLCLTLCDPIDCSLSGSSIHGILQAKILEWVAIPFSKGSYQPGTEPRSLHCFPGGSVVKNLPVMQETCVRSLGGEDPLENETVTHSSIVAWAIPWTEEPGGL